MRQFLRTTPALMAALFVLAMADGCAYFNTFYLAQKDFGDAERIFAQSDDQMTQSARTAYNDAIDWASVILTDHADSRYVDDSLYIIGLSQYRLAQYPRARTTFAELLRAYPESDFTSKALFYQAKCLEAMDLGTEALTMLLELVRTGDREIVGMAGNAIAEISLKNEDWESLLVDAERVVSLDVPDEEHNLGVYYKGEALFQLGRYQECIDTLTDLERMTLPADLRFKVNSRIALSLANIGDYERATALFASMQGRGEFARFAPQIRLELGNIYALQGDDQRAITTYRNLAGDFPDSVAAKEAWYDIGTLLMRDLENAPEALEAFKMVPEGKSRTNAAWFVEAENRAVQLDSLMSKQAEIERLENDLTDRMSGNADSADTLAVAGADSLVEVGMNPEAVLRERLARLRFSLSELYRYSFDRPDLALEQYRSIVEEAPGTEFAIRSEYFIGIDGFRETGTYSEDTERSLMLAIIARYPDSEFSQELRVYLGMIEQSPDETMLSRAEHARSAGEHPDTYIPLFQAVYDTYPGTRSAYQAMFLAAYYLEHDAGMQDQAFEIYRMLADDEPRANSEQYIQLARDKLAFADREPQLLEETRENIAYYEMLIRDLQGERSAAVAQSDTETGDVGGVPSAGENFTGYMKTRERNARIRSHYYAN